MKINIIYDQERGIDPSIFYLGRSLAVANAGFQLIDINSLFGRNGRLHLIKEELVKVLESGAYGAINRIVPSLNSLDKTWAALKTTTFFEQAGFPILNPFQAAQADYSKYANYLMLKKEGISTPKTKKLIDHPGALAFAEEVGFPLILKDDQSGKGASVQKIDNFKSLEEKVIQARMEVKPKVLQEFIYPIREYDCRIAVIGGEVLLSYGRTLTGKNGGPSWKGSYSSGSEIFPYSASEEERELALRSSQAIGAGLNIVDLYFSRKGPVVIENNPTPDCSLQEYELARHKVAKKIISWLEERKHALAQPLSRQPEYLS